LALELGATWVGGAFDEPPAKLDAAIIFAPAGELVPVALKALDKGGVLVLGGIHMSTIPSLDYALITVSGRCAALRINTARMAENFWRRPRGFRSAHTSKTFSFTAANDALIALSMMRFVALECCWLKATAWPGSEVANLKLKSEIQRTRGPRFGPTNS